MALKPSPFRFLWSRLHFLVRLAGVTGLLAGGVGVALVLLNRGGSRETAEAFGRECREALETLFRWDLSALGAFAPEVWLALGGLLAAALALLLETMTVLRFAAGRRSVFGTNALLQVGLATALLVGVNVFSFNYYTRFDWTNDGQFTLSRHLSPALLEQLKQLKDSDPTTIVLYQRNKSFGLLSDKPDMYDFAASPRVVEKVRDLVDQFREMGGKFRVVVLDVEEEGYEDKLKKLTEQAPELREAIEKTPENSIFFHAAGKVQRLGFHDIFQLDKQASQKQGNLVLVNQGVDAFARKLLNIEEKRPRIALGVIHEVLGTEGSEELGMSGLKKTLAARGFDVRDIILKKWSEFAPPEPAVLTYDESKFERLDAQIAELDENIKNAEDDLRRLESYQKDFETKNLDELTKTYAKSLQVPKVTEEIRKAFLERFLKLNIPVIQFVVGQNREERDGLVKEKAGLSVENLQEQRRISDLKAKAERMLADCDLLILPRMTLFNVARGEAIPNQVYRIDDTQVAAVREFLKAGKPVLACFGPSNEPAGRADPAAGPDGLENLFADLGIRLAKQTVLFNVESKSFAERRGGLLILGANVDVPPVRFDWAPGAGYPQKLVQTGQYDRGKPNPIRESLQLTARSLGKDQKLDLRLRHPRPVYYEPVDGTAPARQAVFMMTDAASWNDSEPFPTRERTPRFELPKAGDVTTGTLDEKRRGPFPIAVSAAVSLPAAWYTEKEARPDKPTRVAAIGHGGVFLGQTLSPVKEKLLVDTCNWLLGRDDLLTKDASRWSYPRVEFAGNRKALWQWGGWVGLPVLFAYLGLVVFMVRRLR